ncbi:hypothetical protein ACX801_07840 [Arthrobacter bambusae]
MTPEELEQGRTPKGGFTRKQLEAWGVPWPPPKGWKRVLLTGDKKRAPEWLRAEESNSQARSNAERLPGEGTTHGEVKADRGARKPRGPLVRAEPMGRREDGSPVAGDGQAYATRTGNLFHPQWCSIVAARWRDAPGNVHVTMIADVGQRRRCQQCDTDPELRKQFNSERAEWVRLNRELDRLGRTIARTLVAKGPEGVNQLGPDVIRFRETEAELDTLSRHIAEMLPDSYDAPKW